MYVMFAVSGIELARIREPGRIAALRRQNAGSGGFVWLTTRVDDLRAVDREQVAAAGAVVVHVADAVAAADDSLGHRRPGEAEPRTEVVAIRVRRSARSAIDPSFAATILRPRRIEVRQDVVAPPRLASRTRNAGRGSASAARSRGVVLHVDEVHILAEVRQRARC